MKTYLIAIYNSKNVKTSFITDVITANNEIEAEQGSINKIYYFDSNRSKVLGKCRKAEVIHEII